MHDPADVALSHERALLSRLCAAQAGLDGAPERRWSTLMSASSSRILIAQVDGSRPLSDRFIDRLLSWWDTGGGRTIRRAVRGAVAVSGAKVRTTIAPLMARPLVAKAATMSQTAIATLRRGIAKAFSSEVPTPRREEVLAAVATDATDATDATGVDDAPLPPRPAAVKKSPTCEIRTPVRSATGEIRPRTASAITKPEITPVSSPTRTTMALTTALRCWSCLQRNRVRAPRRGGCFLCSSCNATMLVVDPIVGLTCEVGQAPAKGIRLSREANETDPAIGRGDVDGVR